MRLASESGNWAMKAWPPPLNWGEPGSGDGVNECQGIGGWDNDIFSACGNECGRTQLLQQECPEPRFPRKNGGWGEKCTVQSLQEQNPRSGVVTGAFQWVCRLKEGTKMRAK
jgi:hypothetical protein